MSDSVGGSRASGPHARHEAGIPDDAALALEKAAASFKALLNANHVDEFERATSRSVCADLNSMQARQLELRALVNLKRVQMFLDGMNALQTVLGNLGVENVSGIMACIWGPMGFFFKTTEVNEKAFDHILEVYQQLGLQLLPLSQYMQLFEASRESRWCLVYIYKDVLEFHSIAYKLFSLRNALWAKLHRATWKDLEPTFDHLAATLKLHADFIEKHGAPLHDRHGSRIDSGFGPGPIDTTTTAEQHKVYETTYAEEQRKFKSAEETRRREQKNKILKWIAAPNKTEVEHRKHLQTAEICPENGRWLWRQHDEVSNWISEDLPVWPTVWVQGPRGMGKTILSSLVVRHLEKLAEDGIKVPPDSQVCYFHCYSEDPEFQTYLGILRGILHQLVWAAGVGGEPVSNNHAAILPLCDDKRTTSGGSTLTNPDTAAQLIEVFFEYNSRQYVVVDGLDECETLAEGASTEILQTVQFLNQQVLRCDELSQGQLRVLFVSQSTPDVRKAMTKIGIGPDAGEVILDPKDNLVDIGRWVKKRVDGEWQKFNLTERQKEVIENHVTAQSEGFFLRASLTMAYLSSQINKENLLEKVKPGMLPKKLSKLYEELLEAVKARLQERSEGHWIQARQLLGWLVCAHRPLKWHEIQAILAFNPDREDNPVDFDMRMIREDNIGDYLGSLVHVLPGDNIRLIHSTAKEHLVQTDHIKPEHVQCELATICLRYLSLRCFAAEDYREDERRNDIPHGYFSFQDYAMSCWFRHIVTVVQNCCNVFLEPSFEQGRDYTRSFSTALEMFISAYDADLKLLPDLNGLPDTASDLLRKDIDRYASLPFYGSLFRVWYHIFQHQNSPSEERNKVGIARLDAVLETHRAAIEKDFSPGDKTVNEDTMGDYYGPNLFKCNRTLCRFFHHGFDNKADREKHVKRHDRPYPCKIEGCGFAPVGFSSNKDLQRHMRNYHPNDSDGPTPFLQMSRRTETARFQCTICQKSFTRNINLKGHERSHFGERPYACSTCGKAFARLNDCRRHERIHARRGA
ncbi:zinc finger protein [Colletotrichum sojae]|uniref:Zinc finger protein n=1 Tax=Colletotrichum sojae TaxID=2175907 RepID=A0A8H6MKM6_9PEZI|nr:zinc finger protein [Colletotrichum sojae]